MAIRFRWIDWNIDHIAKHGVDPDEAAMVVRNARPPYPMRSEGDKWLVRGPGRGGRLMQVIFVREDDDIFVIHARPLNEREKRQLRRRRR